MLRRIARTISRLLAATFGTRFYNPVAYYADGTEIFLESIKLDGSGDYGAWGEITLLTLRPDGSTVRRVYTFASVTK